MTEMVFEEGSPADVAVHSYEADGFGRFGKNVLVGHGLKKTKPSCGNYLKTKGCLDVDNHAQSVLEGDCFKGKVHVVMLFHHCDKPDCPECYMRGWAYHEGHVMFERLTKLSQGYIDDKGVKHVAKGEVNHIVVSPPRSLHHIDHKKLRKKCIDALVARKIFGGSMIYHAFRYLNRVNARRLGLTAKWYFAPHYHVLGFVTGGYGKCRRCENLIGDGRIADTAQCLKCDGFEGLTRRLHLGDGKKDGDGFIVKVLGKRKSILRTIKYQLSHASYVDEGKHHVVVHWFGTCSYRKMQLKPKMVKKEHVCELCGGKLVRVRFVGEEGTNPLDVLGVEEAWDNFLGDDGGVRWMEIPDRDSYY